MRPISHGARLLPALACAVAALALSACGAATSATSAPGAGAAAGAEDRDTARLRFQQCMRDQGVDVPDRRAGGGPTGPPSNVDSEKLRAAREACATFREQARGTLTDEQRQEFRDAFTKFASCMRGEGVDLPTPSGAGPGGGGRGGLRQLDRESPKVQAALKACESVLPRRGGRGGGPAPGAGTAQ